MYLTEDRVIEKGGALAYFSSRYVIINSRSFAKCDWSENLIVEGLSCWRGFGTALLVFRAPSVHDYRCQNLDHSYWLASNDAGRVRRWASQLAITYGGPIT